MIKDKYLRRIEKKVSDFNKGRGFKFFIYGSSLVKSHFGDVDLGVMGDAKRKDIVKLKEEFNNSTLPYFVDVINFDKVSEEFKNNVFNNEVLWITR